MPCHGPAAADSLTPAAKNLINSDVRPSTRKTYKSKLKAFLAHCAEEGCDSTSCGVDVILNFLAKIHASGVAYQTLNGYRSAISKHHDYVDSMPVGEIKSIRRLMKGAFNTRPPQPRYSEFWDVSKLMAYLRPMHPPGQLSLMQLSQKLLCLCSLSTCSRVSSLNKLHHEYNVLESDSGKQIEFYISGLEKTSRPSCHRSSFTVPAFIPGFEEAELDLATYLDFYMGATAERRQPPSTIFISNTQVSCHEIIARSLMLTTLFSAALQTCQDLHPQSVATLCLGQRRYRHHQVPGTLHQGGGDLQPRQQGVLHGGDPGEGQLVLRGNFQQVLPPLMPGEALYIYSHCLMFFVDHNSLFRRLGPRLLPPLPRQQQRRARVLLFPPGGQYYFYGELDIVIIITFTQAAYVLGSPDQAHVILGCLPPPPRHNFYFS